MGQRSASSAGCGCCKRQAERLGISCLTARSAGDAVQKRVAGSLAALGRDNVHARLASFLCADPLSTPVIEEQLEDDGAAVAVSPTQPQARDVGEAISSRRRKRGSRRRRKAHLSDDTVSVWSFNSSGAPQLRAAVAHGNALGADCPIAILCQEHHAGPDQLVDHQAQLKSAGWCFAARTPASSIGSGFRGHASQTQAES